VPTGKQAQVRAAGLGPVAGARQASGKGLQW
jgi:hypothetical protein